MVMKVKEPVASEYGYFREGLILFTYLHLAPEPELTKALIDNKVVSIAYETVQLDNRSLPLLAPMSEVAGRMSAQIGAQFLEKTRVVKVFYLQAFQGKTRQSNNYRWWSSWYKRSEDCSRFRCRCNNH